MPNSCGCRGQICPNCTPITRSQSCKTCGAFSRIGRFKRQLSNAIHCRRIAWIIFEIRQQTQHGTSRFFQVIQVQVCNIKQGFGPGLAAFKLLFSKQHICKCPKIASLFKLVCANFQLLNQPRIYNCSIIGVGCQLTKLGHSVRLKLGSMRNGRD